MIDPPLAKRVAVKLAIKILRERGAHAPAYNFRRQHFQTITEVRSAEAKTHQSLVTGDRFVYVPS